MWETSCDLRLDLGRCAIYMIRNCLACISNPFLFLVCLGAVISYLDPFVLMKLFLYMHSSSGMSVKGVLESRPLPPPSLSDLKTTILLNISFPSSGSVPLTPVTAPPLFRKGCYANQADSLKAFKISSHLDLDSYSSESHGKN